MNLSWVTSEPFNPSTYQRDAIARHRRLRTPERRQDAPPVTKPVVVVMNEREGMQIAMRERSRPARKEDADAHVRAYRLAKVVQSEKSSAVSYIKARCEQLGVEYSAIMGSGRTVPVRHARDTLVLEIRSRYPEKSLPQMGLLFGKDHTSILHILKKSGHQPKRSPPISPEKVSEITRLLDQGLSLKEIGIRVGVSGATVAKYRDPDDYRTRRRAYEKRVKHG